jgi:hypothetical protein
MKWLRANRLLPVTLALVAVVTIVLVVAAGRQARTWQKTGVQISDLLRTIADLEGKVEKRRELQPKLGGAHRKGDSMDDGQVVGELLDRRVGPVEAMTPLACKLHLATACRKMTLRLNAVDCAVPVGMGYGFDQWLRDGALPEPDMVPQLLRRLELTEELAYQAARAELSELKRLAYLGEQLRGGDRLTGFRIEASGTTASVQHFLELLDQANYLFVVRSVDWRFAEGGDTAVSVVVHYLELELEPLLLLRAAVTMATEDRPIEPVNSIAHPN